MYSLWYGPVGSEKETLVGICCGLHMEEARSRTLNGMNGHHLGKLAPVVFIHPSFFFLGHYELCHEIYEAHSCSYEDKPQLAISFRDRNEFSDTNV